jgi:integrase
MASIVKRVHKHRTTYYLAYHIEHRLVRKRVGTSLALARKALGELEAKIERKDSGLAPKDQDLTAFFSEYFERTRPAHVESYQRRLAQVKNNFEEFLAARHNGINRLSQITMTLVEEYKDYRIGKLIPQGTRRIKKRTLNLEVVALKGMLNKAVRWGHLSVNPLLGIEMLKTDDAKRRRALSEEEVHKLLDACPDWFYPVVFTALFTGMREGELRYLVWDDIDFDNHLIRIQQKEGWVPKSTGGRIRERAIPMTPELTAYMGTHMMKHRARSPKWVFTREDGSQLPRDLRTFMIRAARRAGIMDVTQFHALRDTFATHLIKSGADLVTAKDILGHVDIQTTMRYAKPVDDHKRAMMNNLTYGGRFRPRDAKEDPKKGAAGA